MYKGYGVEIGMCVALQPNLDSATRSGEINPSPSQATERSGITLFLILMLIKNLLFSLYHYLGSLLSLLSIHYIQVPMT